MTVLADYSAAVAAHTAAVEAETAAHVALEAARLAASDAGVARHKAALQLLTAACRQVSLEVVAGTATPVACEAAVARNLGDGRTVKRVVWIINGSVDVEETVAGFRQNILSVDQLDPDDPIGGIVAALSEAFALS